MNIAVSILVPIYKIPEKLLRQCIESLINQTLSNIEIILVDDGSPDKCGEICDEYALKDSRIKVIHKNNGGLSAARNSAFYESTGKYIMFLDGDDYLEKDACERAYSLAIEKNVQLVFWDQITEYKNSSKLVVTDRNGPRLYSGDECKILQERILDFNGKMAQVFCKLIDREFMVRNNIIHNEKLKQGAEGIVFNILLFENLDSAYYANIALNHYVYYENSISHSHNEENYYLIVRCFEEVKRFISNSKNKKELTSKLYNRLLYVIVTTGVTGYFNPMNKEGYFEKVKKYKTFLQEPLLIEALNRADMRGISIQRKIILTLIKYKIFWPIMVLGKIRRKQMMNK